MALVVQKYGGTSMGDLDRIAHVAERVIAAKKAGHDVVVVVSAIGGETDRLIDMATQIHPDPDPREYAVLVSTGEQVSIALLSLYLIHQGVPARSYTGMQVRIITDQYYHQARIEAIECQNIQTDLAEGRVVVVAGFQGTTRNNDITSLGRGGSDTTAVALAAALKAEECQIYTDVDGVYTADPRVVPQASRLDQITFEEMVELSGLGAKVLQSRAVEFAGKYRVPLRVLSSFVEGPGTLIVFEDTRMEKPIVSGIVYNRSEAKLTIRGVPDIPGIASRIIEPISDAKIDIDMIIQNVSSDGTTDFTFTTHRDECQRAVAILEVVAKDLGANIVTANNRIAKLSIVGVGMRTNAGVASRMFQALAKEGINIQMIATSEIKVSVVIDEKYLELGARALHSVFGLDAEPLEEFDPMPSGGA